MQCKGPCRAVLRHTCFDQDKLRRWRKNREVGRCAICLECEKKPKPEKEKPIKCAKCGQEQEVSQFDPVMLAQRRKYCHMAKRAVCNNCRAKPVVKPIQCVKCGVEKEVSSFDPLMLARWRNNHEMARRAECNCCRANRDVTTQAPKNAWRRSKRSPAKSRSTLGPL